MTFYADPSFFMLLALAMAGAAFLGLREKPIARYGMVASVAFLACLFCKDLPGLAVAALFVATATLSTRWVWRASPNGRFAVAFASSWVPLLSGGAVPDQNSYGVLHHVQGAAGAVRGARRATEELGPPTTCTSCCSSGVHRLHRLLAPIRRRCAQDPCATSTRLWRGHPRFGRARVHLRHSCLAAPLLCADSLGTGPFLAELGVQANGVMYGLYRFRLRGLQPMAMGPATAFESARCATSARRAAVTSRTGTGGTSRCRSSCATVFMRFRASR
ncbi:MAG: hypothetical protein ACLTMP_09845 [Eggerthella lenta]